MSTVVLDSVSSLPSHPYIAPVKLAAIFLSVLSTARAYAGLTHVGS